MQWFLERIGTEGVPICFGICDSRKYSKEFSKLVAKGVLKRIDNLDMVSCDLCDESHESQVRQNGGELFYVCEHGGGKKVLADEELFVYEFDNDAFLRIIAEELGISSAGSITNVSGSPFYSMGTWQKQSVGMGVYYARTHSVDELLIRCIHDGGIKLLITNTTKPSQIIANDGTIYCTLAEILDTSSDEHFFDTTKFQECVNGLRRVYFNVEQAQLYLDNKLVYTAGLQSPEHHFLTCLWERWQTQVPHTEIHRFVKSKVGHDVADTAQKFCNKMKSSIKKSCTQIDSIITIPTVKHYMMSDPV